MKLYTEEKLRNSMLSMKTYIEKYDESVIDKIIENHIRALGGVKLPSDEEIEQNAHLEYPVNSQPVGITLAGLRYDADINYSERKAYILSAKNLINKIQGGNK